MNLQGAYIQAYEICHLRCDNNNNHCYAIGTIDGNVTCVCHLLLGSNLSYCDMLVDISIDIIYSTLGNW